MPMRCRAAKVGENLWWTDEMRRNPSLVRTSETLERWFAKFHPKAYKSVCKKIGDPHTASQFAKAASVYRPSLVAEFNRRRIRFVNARKGLLI